ncbi:MAG: RNA polymerase sigma factor [Chitinophagaceae bacterium]
MYKDHETPRFWITYQDALRKYLLKRLNDKSAINDILHDVYIKIFVYCKRYDFCCEKAGVKNLRSWVFQVCHNTMLDYLKEKSKQCNHCDLLTCDIEDVNIEQRHEFMNAEELIRKLPSKYAEPVFHDTILRMKQADIAQKLGLSLSATKSRILRGKKMLKDLYSLRAEN